MTGKRDGIGQRLARRRSIPIAAIDRLAPVAPDEVAVTSAIEGTASPRWAEPPLSARRDQMSIFSAISMASSTSMPR